MIKRLQWLYPPTGYKFMINLSSILCNRLERTTQSLYEKSLMDGLTGVYNQKGFMDVLRRQEEYARRYGSEITLCLIGVRFSTADINSSYHTRRTLLTVLARTLHDQLRQCDAMARIDFRTFALLLPHTSLQNGEKACHRLLEELQYQPLEAEGCRLHIHYGLASTNTDTPRTAGPLLERAAAALREASSADDIKRELSKPV
jgi:diguanylate cyclase (GGDEF)-like protein